jgi:thioredoxin reductase
MNEAIWDVAVVGGGPAGLAAALALGRSRRKTLVFDSGPRRNARAVHMHNFVTRDGMTPIEFRAVGRSQLQPYTSVECRDEGVLSIEKRGDHFQVNGDGGSVLTRRVLLCTGMVDDLPGIPGFQEFWGTSIFQCPYCHGWENRDLRWGYLMQSLDTLDFVLKLQTWTAELTVYTNNSLVLPTDVEQRLHGRGIMVEPRAIRRLIPKQLDPNAMLGVELSDGQAVECDVLYAHPKQHHVPLVASLEIALDPNGYVMADAMTRRTSVAGVYAAGDLTSRMQGAIFAAAAGTQAATVINHDLATSA